MAKLYFYYSAMNAGKTTTLLQSSYNYQERGMETAMFLPKVDDRAQTGRIASRIGLESDATTFDTDYDFLTSIRQIKRLQKPALSCVLVDEAQFLKKEQVRQLASVVDDLGLPVLCYGLRTDFKGEPFEGSQYLLAWAEKLVELKAICFCGQKATMNLRVDKDGLPVNEGEQIEIGGNNRYIAVCRKHYMNCLKDRKPAMKHVKVAA